MNKIQEELKGKAYDLCMYMLDPDHESFDFNDMKQVCLYGLEAGYKSANPLPTTKVCPECGGSGKTIKETNPRLRDNKCTRCKDGIIQIYYTPEEYKEIIGKDYPDDCLVWNYWGESFQSGLFKWVKKYNNILPIYIVQTAQPSPRGRL